jgi:hypothetical protein
MTSSFGELETAKESEMANLGRRSVLRGSVGFAAAGALMRPYIANAAATTATVWWTQGFVHAEDIAFRKIVENYEKASGNTIEYTIMPTAPITPEDRLGSDRWGGS